MTYFTYVLNSVYYVANSIYIPIPITPTYTYKFSIFSLLMASIVIGILVYLFSRLLGIGGGILFGEVSDGIRTSMNTHIDKEKAEQRQGTYRRRTQGREIYNRRRVQGIMNKSK